jgi:glutaminase
VLRAKVGADPAGMAFNSMTALELHDDHPQSPLVNAGAIASVSLVPAANAEGRWAKILAFQSRTADMHVILMTQPIPDGHRVRPGWSRACCCAKPPDHH